MKDTFRKNIDLPLCDKIELEVMALRENHGDLKTMIQNITMDALKDFKKGETKSETISNDSKPILDGG